MGHYHWKWVLHMKRKFALTSCFEANRNCINCNRKGMHLQCQSTRGMSLQFKLSGAKMIGKYPIYYQNKRKYYKHFPSSCKQKHDRDLTIRQTEQKPLHTSTSVWAHYPSITTIGLRVCVCFSVFILSFPFLWCFLLFAAEQSTLKCANTIYAMLFDNRINFAAEYARAPRSIGKKCDCMCILNIYKTVSRKKREKTEIEKYWRRSNIAERKSVHEEEDEKKKLIELEWRRR